jgi:mono/diheme cytochrome c family protein
MAERSVFNPISDEEQWRVATYLIAISPDLQRGMQQKRQQETIAASATAGPEGRDLPMLLEAAATKSFDLALAKQTFEATCSQCHRLTNVDKSPPASAKETAELITRMVGNGLKAPAKDLEQVAFYVTKTYVK